VAERIVRRADAPHDVANLVALAELQRRAGRADDAAATLAEAVRLEPEDVRLRTRLAFLLYDAKDYGASVEHLRALRERMPSRPCVDLYLANALAWSRDRGRDPSEAAATYRRFLERTPRATALWLSIARLHGEAGETEAGIDAWRRAMAARPADSRARRGLALALAQAGRLDDAEFERAADADPALMRVVVARVDATPGGQKARRFVERYLDGHADDDALRLELARALARGGDADAAFGHFRALLRRNPEDAAVTMELVGVLTTHQAWDAALTVLDEALARRPGDLALRKTRADVLSWRGADLERHHAEIAAAWEAFLAEHPEDGPARLGLARLRADRGDPAGAAALIARYREDHPLDAAAARLHGEVLLRLKRDAEAVPPLELAARHAPDDIVLAVTLARAMHGAGLGPNRLDPVLARVRSGARTAADRLAFARLLVAMGRPTDAVPEFERALGEPPADAAARLELAWLHLSAKRPDRARALLRPLLGADPAHAEARLALAHALAAEDDPEAATHYERYLADNPSAAEARLAFADALARQKEPERALGEYRRALAGEPGGDVGRRARLAIARTLLDTGHPDAARAELDALLATAPGDAEVKLMRAEALAAEGDGEAARAALASLAGGDDPRVRAEARRRAEALDGDVGPLLTPAARFFADSDGLTEWGTRLEAGRRLGDHRTTLGARYDLAAISQDPRDDGVDTAGETAVHTLQGFGTYRIRRGLEVGAAAGVDVVRGRAVGDFGLNVRWDGNAFFARYDGWRRALYRDVRAGAVLGPNDTGIWQRLQGGWQGERLRLEGHYVSALPSDGNVGHVFGASALWTATKPLQIGLLVDAPTWQDPSRRYWTPLGGVHARGLVRYGFEPAEGLTAAVEATLGAFHESARGAHAIDGVPFDGEARDVLTYSLAPSLRARLARGVTVLGEVALGQSGPGLVETAYRSLQAQFGAEVVW
jgi:predicted Zn-dependent protease